ncbi:hypothetical protein ACWFQ8_18125 [Streptomyces sp. NPDC055254]
MDLEADAARQGVVSGPDVTRLPRSRVPEAVVNVTADMSTTKRTFAAVILTGAALATTGTAQASAAEAQNLANVAPVVVDTLHDTIEDPFGQVHNTAAGLLRGVLGQKVVG